MLDDNHYKKMRMQPIDVHNRHNLNYTAQAFLKYISRHEHKGRLRDLEQALDFGIEQTRKECENGLLQYHNGYQLGETIEEYCILNRFNGRRREAITYYFQAILSDDPTEDLLNAEIALRRYIRECYEAGS